MEMNSIVQITSSTTSAIGTGFVIDSNGQESIVATCAHVVSACGADTLLVNGEAATLQQDFSSERLDLAILSIQGLELKPLPLEDQQSPKVKLYGYTQFNTSRQANIKGEWMYEVEAKHDVQLTGKGQTIEIMRLSSQHKISSGYSGSPVICEETGAVVGMVALEVRGNSIDSYSNYAIAIKHILEACQLEKKAPASSSFVREVMDRLERERLIVLFSQDFTPVDHYLQSIKHQLNTKFGDAFYPLSIPSFIDDEAEYFQEIAECCGLHDEVSKLHHWKKAIHKRLNNDSSPLLLFITDFEDGCEEYDKQLSKALRSLKSKFSHFYVLFVGRKALANLVYKDGGLSPLYNVEQLFFPEGSLKLGKQKIAAQFHSLNKKYKEYLCELLRESDLGDTSPWSSNTTVNELFWRNLLVIQNDRKIWRGELTRQIGQEVLKCIES